MRKNIIEIMEDRELIEELHSKTKEIKKKVLKINSHISSTEYFIAFFLAFLNFSYFLYIWNEAIFENNTDGIMMCIGALLLVSFISSFFFKLVIILFKTFILYKIINKKQPIVSKEDLSYFLRNNKDINNILINFEESLTQKELEYYNEYDFFNISSEEWFMYVMYKSKLKRANIKILIDCKVKIIEYIKENFSVYYQKKLFEDLSKTIEKNTVDKELDRLNSSYNKIEKKIINQLSIEN